MADTALKLSNVIEEIFEYKHSLMAKITFKYFTMVGEIFEYKHIAIKVSIVPSQMAETALNCPPWLEKLLNISTLRLLKLHSNCPI